MDDDGDDKDDTKRRTRNLSEKKRRDQFNMLVNELSSMVSTTNRKMDKSTVLKSTISFLKNHNEITVRSRAHDIQEDWKPSFLSNEEFTYLILEALEGFLMVFSTNGKIFYASERIMALLGHNPADIINKSIFDLVFEDDRANLYNLLHNPQSSNDTLQQPENDNEIRFQCHVRRGTLDFREEATYELIQFNGYFRTNIEDPDNNNMADYQDDSQLLVVCTGRLYTQLIRDVSLVDATRNEFTSRHSLEWKFLFLDHRAPPIIGYLPFEVLGTSGYDYYHFDDLEKVVTCHEALMQKGELTSCYYRFLTKGQQWIWLQTRFYITYHQWNSKPEFIVCTHRVVSYADVMKEAKPEEPEEQHQLESEPVMEAEMKEPPADDALVYMSPSYMSERASVKSASAGSTAGTVTTIGTAATASASWSRPAHTRYTAGSDSASVSSESWSSQRNGSREIQKTSDALPQHGMGAQYLEPEPYLSGCAVGVGVGVGVQGVMPLSMPARPVLVSQDHAQMQFYQIESDQDIKWPRQEQLQRKHEQLQQMIVQQQEELRQVKEQLLLARLGILQPLMNNPFISPEEMQESQRLPATPMAYETTARAPPGFPPPAPASQGHPHLPQ